MAQTYPPLRIAGDVAKYGGGLGRINRIFKFNEDGEPLNIGHDDMVKFFTNPDFMQNPPHTLTKLRGDRLGMFERCLMMNCDEIFQMFDYSDTAVNSDTFSPSAEIKDIFLSPILWDDWSKYKQVFKPDMYFADALLHTKKLQISRQMLHHLPCDTFYIDLSGCPQFGEICGMLVSVLDTAIDCRISTILVGKQLETFTSYSTGTWDEQNIMEISLEEFNNQRIRNNSPEKNFEVIGKNYEDFEIREIITPVSRTEMHVFAFQMISYLSIDEPQLSESPLTKNTYRPRSTSSPIRNKWSEVKIDDVGIIYGKAFRKTLEEFKNESEDSDSEDDSNVDETEPKKRRKSPVPHFRSAHWQRFWVGKGRTKCKVTWVEPALIGAKQNKNVVIHTVK